MIRKENYYRSKEWLAAVRKLDCCVRCGRYGVQAAHMNQGKGMGMKQHDCLTKLLGHRQQRMTDVYNSARGLHEVMIVTLNNEVTNGR